MERILKGDIMYDIYLKRIHINKVRHLEGVNIDISSESKKNLVLTGKNGSGKTSVLEAIANQLDYLSRKGDFESIEERISIYTNDVNNRIKNNESENSIREIRDNIKRQKRLLEGAKSGLDIEYSLDCNGLKTHFRDGDFILAFYKSNRVFESEVAKHIEKPTILKTYGINDSPRIEFIKYLADLKVSEALALNSNKSEKARKISEWFVSFEKELKRVFEDDSIHLVFNDETYLFDIFQEGREPFGFNELSDGFAAILDIIVDIMMRMVHSANGEFSYNLPGIVLIDEIETHLHLELQKKVMGFITTLFPNVQFIVSTHSPFIINSTKNAVIYDLEKNLLIPEGLNDLPYEGVVDGFFGVDRLSQELKEKLNRYRVLTGKDKIDKEDMREVIDLESYLDEVPDYLALDLATTYAGLKTEFNNRRRKANGKS